MSGAPRIVLTHPNTPGRTGLTRDIILKYTMKVCRCLAFVNLNCASKLGSR
jgi:hypothetical protein